MPEDPTEISEGGDGPAGAHVWRRSEGWTYELFPLDTPAETFGPHASFVALWQERRRRRDGLLPARTDFAFEDFRDWWGWITIIDLLEADGSAVRYRLWGTKVGELTRLEMTGRTMREGCVSRDDALYYNETDAAFMRVLVERQAIGRCAGPIDWDMPGFRSMATVRLPLAQDGERIDAYLNAVVPS